MLCGGTRDKKKKRGKEKRARVCLLRALTNEHYSYERRPITTSKPYMFSGASGRKKKKEEKGGGGKGADFGSESFACFT